MTHTKHTPGPWEIHLSEEPFSRLEIINDDLDLHIAEVYFGDLPNAHLIAAAPRLLKALKQTLAQLKILTDGPGQVHDERQAIIEAEEAIALAEKSD
jgi:hypothetical protein